MMCVCVCVESVDQVKKFCVCVCAGRAGQNVVFVPQEIAKLALDVNTLFQHTHTHSHSPSISLSLSHTHTHTHMHTTCDVRKEMNRVAFIVGNI